MKRVPAPDCTTKQPHTAQDHTVIQLSNDNSGGISYGNAITQKFQENTFHRASCHLQLVPHRWAEIHDKVKRLGSTEKRATA